jgi:hypothetical protein
MVFMDDVTTAFVGRQSHRLDFYTLKRAGVFDR